MTAELVVQILRQALGMTFVLCAPLLAVGFVVGIIISLVQIVTSIQDTAFNTIPRLTAFLVTFLVALPWLLKQITTYTVLLLGDLGRYAK